MASNNTFHSSAGSLTPAILRRRKHRNSAVAVAVALRRRGTRKKHSGTSPVNFRQGFEKNEFSARKLAAGLWQLRFVEVFLKSCADIKDGSFCSSVSKPANENVKDTFPHYHYSGEKSREKKDQLRRPITILRSRNGLLCEHETSMSCLKRSKRERTKRNPALNEASSRKLHKDRKLVGGCDSLVTVLQEELLQAQRTINKLKAAVKSSKKKVKLLLKNLEEEKFIWKPREIQKIEAMLGDLKDKLARERRSREMMEALNTKLGHELAVANQSAKQLMTKLEEEKGERELTEEVCYELAMQIKEDKAKLEELLSNSMKICEEVEEERKMMQMAEELREERVQMKLVDAKLLLEEKYNQMVQLIAYLQMFLRSKGAEIDTNELEAAQLIQEAVESVDIQRIVELSYDFSRSDDTFPLYEELRREDNVGERMITLNSLHILTVPLSTIHIESLDEEGLNENSVFQQSTPSSDYNTGLELSHSLETAGHIKDQKLSSLPQMRDTHLNQYENISESEAECSEKAGLESKWKSSPSTKQLRPCTSDGTTVSYTKSSQQRRPGDGWCKQKEYNWRLVTSLHKSSSDGSFKRSELLGQGNSTDNMNFHITRGMKGCIEWPRGIPKANSKVIPLEERVKRQKSLLKHILK